MQLWDHLKWMAYTFDRVQQIDLKWCVIMCTKSATSIYSILPQDLTNTILRFLWVCHSKCLCLCCFLYGLVKNWYQQSTWASFSLWVLYWNSILKTQEATTQRYSFKVFFLNVGKSLKRLLIFNKDILPRIFFKFWVISDFLKF